MPLLSVLDIVTALAKHHAVARVIHSLWVAVPGCNVVHVLAEPAATSAQRMLRKQHVAELSPLPTAVDALLTLLLAATPCLEGNGWYRKLVLKCHVATPR